MDSRRLRTTGCLSEGGDAKGSLILQSKKGRGLLYIYQTLYN